VSGGAHDGDPARGDDHACCQHNLTGAIDAGERRALGARLTAALAAVGLLVLALGLLLLVPAQAAVAHLLAGATASRRTAVLVGVPVLRDAVAGLRRPTLHAITDQLVAVAILGAVVVGDLESAALVPLAMTIGHILEERSLIGSQEAIAALARLTRVAGRRLRADGGVDEVAAEALRPGDRIEVRPGDRLAADGVVRTGISAVDTSPITGESVPIEIAPGDAVLAGAINQHGRIEVEIVRTGAATALGKVVALMRDAERAKPPVTRLLERHAGAYLGLILLIAAGVLVSTGSATAAMTVLVAACPCALVLAAPATAIAAIAVAGRHGILIKGTAFLEELAEVDALIIDKTGTLTVGELRIAGLQACPGIDPGDLRRLAGSLGAASSHPVSRACAAALPAHDRLAITAIAEVGGQGLSGTRADGSAVAMGRPTWLAEHVPGGAIVPPTHDGPVVGVAAAGHLLGWILLADEPRADARAALDDLRGLGLSRQILVTGDRRAVAGRVAEALGITEVDAEVLPDQKLARVRSELTGGRRPLVVGDGVNDALALKAGAVGVAMGARGTDVALASADIVLMGERLGRLATCVRLARRARRTINTNVGIGLGWTAVVLAGGAAGLYGPLWAALLHNLGTLAVMANAGRLLRVDDRG
jgi:Zn2+/Cd2+-exporting ATPase